MCIPEKQMVSLVMNRNWLIYLLVLLPTVLFSQNIKLRELAAYIDIEQKNYQRANDTLHVLIQQNTSADLYLAKATILYELNDLQQALEYCHRAHKLKPYCASELKIKIYLKDNQKQDVQNALNENLKSNYKISLFNLLQDPDFAGIYNMELDQYVLSENFYSKTEKQIYQVKRMIAEKKNNQALFLIDEILSRNDNIAEAHYMKSQLTFATDDLENALRSVNTAIELNRSNADYLKQRIKVYKGLERYDEALNDANKLVRIESNRIENYILKAQLLFDTEQYDEASELTESLLQILPDDPDLLYLSSKSYYMKKDYFEALKAINQAMALKAGKEAYELRGDIYTATGTFIYAIRDYSMVLDIDPYNGDIYAKKGFARLKSGDKKGACADWTKGKRYGSYVANEYLEKYCR